MYPDPFRDFALDEDCWEAESRQG